MSQTAAVPLEGTQWLLTATVDGDAAAPVPDGVEATVSISDGHLSVQAGCNRGGAAVRIDGDVVRSEPIITTQMACDEDRMRVESAVLEVLDANPTFRIEGDELHLSSTARGLVFNAR